MTATDAPLPGMPKGEILTSLCMSQLCNRPGLPVLARPFEERPAWLQVGGGRARDPGSLRVPLAETYEWVQARAHWQSGTQAEAHALPRDKRVSLKDTFDVSAAVPKSAELRRSRIFKLRLQCRHLNRSSTN